MALSRGTGSRVAVQTITVGGELVDIPAFIAADASGNPQDGALAAGTDRSGTAGTTASQLAPANATRRGMYVQNISANNLGVNEVGGTAAIGTAGTYMLAAGAGMSIRTNRAISVIASAASSAYTATEC